MLLRAAARLRLVDIAINAITAGIRPSPTTRAGTAIVRSARPMPGINGFDFANRSFYRHLLSRGLQRAASTRSTHMAEQASAVRSPIRGQRRDAA